NHDKVGAGLENTDGFNYLARHAIEWTANALTPDHHSWLAALPQGPVVVDDLVEICHGTPFDEDVYIFDDLDAMRALHVARRPLCLFGHTHVVAAFGLLDTVTRTLSLVRVEYDIGTAQAKIVGAGLPDVLAQRLAVGR